MRGSILACVGCAILSGTACERFAAGHSGSDRLEIVVSGDSVRLSHPPGVPEAPAASGVASDLRLTGLTHPRDVTRLAGDSLAVLDAMDASVVVFDPSGKRVREFGRHGQGPGEFLDPYAIASFGDELLAVWDRSGRITVLRTDGTVVATRSDMVGDARAIHQRSPFSIWEEPLQLSQEDVTRRLGRIGKNHFALALQPDERYDEVFVASGKFQRFPQSLIVFDSLAQVVDTLLSMPGPDVYMNRVQSDFIIGLPEERPYAQRPLWTAGDGWFAYGHGESPTVTVVFDDGRRMLVTWPQRDWGDREAAFDAYLDWEIEGYRRTKGERAYRRVSELPRKEWKAEIMGPQGDVGPPQLTGLLGAGPCLAILGFAPEDSPHGESTTVVVLNLERGPEVRQFRLLATEPGFIRALESNAIYYLAVEEDGTRVIERYPIPNGFCGGPS